jgi:DNA-binding NarL/FixJ family response regulator
MDAGGHLDIRSHVQPNNAASRRVLSRKPQSLLSVPYLVKKRHELLVNVEANGALRPRILAALAAEDLSIIEAGSRPPAQIKIVAADLSQPISLRRLRAKLATPRPTLVVVVSPECGPLGARRAVRAGADSLVLEHEIDEALLPAVRAVAAGLSVLPAVLRDEMDRLSFSHREREVLRLAVEGNTNSEIAAALFLAESTVKSHLSSAYRKLGAVGRKDAAALILDPEEGLVKLILGQEPQRSAVTPGLAAFG